MNSTRPRVALISSSYHPHFGGVEEHVRHVAKGLQARGQAVEIWTVDRGDGLRDEMVDGCRTRYLPTPLPARSTRAMVSFAIHAPRALVMWIRAYSDFRPEVLHVQCFGPNGIYALALARLTGTPLVVSAHGETLADEHSVFDRSALLRASLRQAVHSGVVTACSSLVANDLSARFGAGQVTVVPNGVELASDDAAPRRPPVGEVHPVLLGAGRLVPVKGFDILLRAAAEARHNTRVVIVGDGAQRACLESLAADLGIADRVDFLGRRSSDEVRELMAEATAVVVPSRVEAFGIVVLEAWASGTPLLATNRGGPADLVTDGHDGVLIDPNDLSSVVTGIDHVLGNPEFASRLALEGKQTVRSYTWERVVDLYDGLYSQLL